MKLSVGTRLRKDEAGHIGEDKLDGFVRQQMARELARLFAEKIPVQYKDPYPNVSGNDFLQAGQTVTMPSVEYKMEGVFITIKQMLEIINILGELRESNDYHQRMLVGKMRSILLDEIPTTPSADTPA